PILPFLIGPAEVPLGFGGLNHTKAHDWDGEEGHQGYKELKAKLTKTIGIGRNPAGTLERIRELTVRGKTLRLPVFAFSLSSHDTQVTPKEGATLLRLLGPDAALISAYDAWKCSRDKYFHYTIKSLCESETVLF